MQSFTFASHIPNSQSTQGIYICVCVERERIWEQFKPLDLKWKLFFGLKTDFLFLLVHLFLSILWKHLMRWPTGCQVQSYFPQYIHLVIIWKIMLAHIWIVTPTFHTNWSNLDVCITFLSQQFLEWRGQAFGRELIEFLGPTSKVSRISWEMV
jgi:hypothetical protein